MPWARFEEWKAWNDRGSEFRLHGVGPDGRRDLAAQITMRGGSWRINAWRDLAIGPDACERFLHKGTLEEAKAVAVALVRLG